MTANRYPSWTGSETPFPHFWGVVSVPHRVRAGAGQGLLV